MLLKIVELLLYELFFLVPFIYYRPLYTPWDFKVFFLFYVFLVTGVGWIIYLTSRRKRDLGLTPEVLIYLLIVIISWYAGKARFRGMMFFWGYTLSVLLGFLSSKILDQRKVVFLVTLGALLLGIEGVAQHFHQPLFLGWSRSFPNRIFSFIGNPNAFGVYIAMVLMLCLIAFKGWFKYVLALFFVVLIIWTRSRGALIALIIAGLILVFIKKRWLGIGIIVAGTVIVFLGHTKAKQMLWTSSSKQRAYLYITAMSLAYQRPLWGYGFYSFRDKMQYKVLPQFRRLLRRTEVGAKFPHNEYLNQLVMFGIIGFAFFALLLLRGIHRNPYFPVLWVVYVHNLFSFPLFYPSIALVFWYLLFIKTSENKNAQMAMKVSGTGQYITLAVLSVLLILGLYYVSRYYIGRQHLKQYMVKRNIRYLQPLRHFNGFKMKLVNEKLGNYYLSHKDYYHALLFYKQNLRDFIVTPAGLINIGVVYERWTQYTQALYFYKKALAIRYDGDILGRIGQVYGFLGRYNLADKYFRLALIDEPWNFELYLKRAYVWIMAAKYDLALKIMKSALPLREFGADSDRAALLKNMGYCYLKLGKIDEALAFFSGFLKDTSLIKAEKQEIYYLLAAFYEQKGDKQRRDDYLTKFNSINSARR